MSMNFLYVTLKSIICYFMQWKILIHLSYADILNVDIFHHTIFFKIICLNITSRMRKVSSGTLSSSQWQSQVFQSSIFLLEHLNFFIGKKYFKLLSLK